MPGIIGLIDRDASSGERMATLDRMVEGISWQPWYEKAVVHQDAAAVACVHLGKFDHAIIASDQERGITVVLNGWLYGWKSGDHINRGREDAAHHCLQEYLRHGVGMVERLHGQFNLLIVDGKRGATYLANDRYGLRIWQYGVFGGRLLFAPEAKAILRGGDISACLNSRMMLNQLVYGRIWIGDEALFDGIRFLPPGTVLEWNSGKVSTYKYWDYVYEPDWGRSRDIVEDCVERFRQAVRKCLAVGHRQGIALSGGLDSRTVLAAVPQQLRQKVTAYSWGVSSRHDELRLAERTANAAGVPWVFLRLQPRDFVQWARQSVRDTEGQDMFVQGYSREVYAQLRPQTDMLLTGLALDLFLGGSYLPAKAVIEGEADDAFLIDWMWKKASLFSTEEVRYLFREGPLRDLDDLREAALEEWGDGPNAEPADRCDRFFAHARVWRYTVMRQSGQRQFVEDLCPTFDDDLVDAMLGIPAELRVGHQFYRRFLSCLAPELMEIPYQRTMLPPTVPTEYWGRASKIEAEREELYRQIYYATGGEVYLPYTRYYSNFDEWLRTDRLWIDLCDELLMARDSRICEEFMRPDRVAELIEEHRSGKRTHYPRLIQMMTTELVLREFFA